VGTVPAELGHMDIIVRSNSVVIIVTAVAAMVTRHVVIQPGGR
jgi:hypothetical protein